MSDAPLSDQELERLIARAIEIDAQEAVPTIARFRQIATELNLSPVAIEKALAERAAGALMATWQPSQPQYAVSADAALPARRVSRWKSWLTAGSVAAGAALGAISGATSRLQLPYGDAVVFTTLALLVVISTLLVWTHRRSRSSAQMMLQLASFWSTWMYGFMTSYGHFWDDILLFGACGFGISAIAGALLQSLQQRFQITRKMSAYVTPVPPSYATPNP